MAGSKKQQEGKKKGCKKAGRSKRPGEAAKRARHQDYAPVNKLRRILGANGPEAALKWAKEHAAFGALHKLKQRSPGVFARAHEKSEAFRKFSDGK